MEKPPLSTDFVSCLDGKYFVESISVCAVRGDS